MHVLDTLEVSNAAEWRGWLTRNHNVKREVWLVFYRKATGRQAVSYYEAVREALCFGWIDGQIKSIGEQKFARRFSPRRPRSNWSMSNRARVRELFREGRMTPAGLEILPTEIFEEFEEDGES